MIKNEHTVYANGVHGNRIWKIHSEGNVIHIFANGAHFTEVINKGMAGRTIEQQVELRVNARVRNKLDQGFVYDVSKVSNMPVNQLGTFMPMLAERLDKQKNFSYDGGVYGQYKLNGHRNLMNSDISYTRGGKETTTIRDIEKTQNLPYGMTVDGELYCHGYPLQTIASWARRKQPNTDKLKYYVYDIIIEDEPNMPFADRFELLQKVIKLNDRVILTPTFKVSSAEETRNHFLEARDGKYEGLILRPEGGTYQVGKRSKKLLKVKHYEDEEFEVVGAHLSERSGLPVFDLITDKGIPFKATIHGPHPQKFAIYKNIERHIGRKVTCEFESYTLDGKPSQAVATGWESDK